VKFLCDHDVATDVARVLRLRGHDIVELREALPPDTPDAAIWAHACAEGRTFVPALVELRGLIAREVLTYPAADATGGTELKGAGLTAE